MADLPGCAGGIARLFDLSFLLARCPELRSRLGMVQPAQHWNLGHATRGPGGSSHFCGDRRVGWCEPARLAAPLGGSDGRARCDFHLADIRRGVRQMVVGSVPSRSRLR